MWIPICFLALALGASAAPKPFKSCGPQNIVLKKVTDTWSLPTTKMANMTTCTYNFQIPNGTFAEVILNGSRLGSQDSIYAAGIQSPFKGPNNTYQLTTLSPSKFDVTFTAGENTTMSVQFCVKLQNVNRTVVKSFSVRSNNDSKLIYLDEWKAGTSYKVASDSLVRLNTAFNGVYVGTRSQLNNIFIFDGENATTLLFAQGSFYLSRNKNVTLYLARNITDLKGALFLTDNSNLNGTINHHVEFVPTDPNYPTSWVSMVADWQEKPNSPWGAVTIVGKADGSTPIHVRDLRTMSGSGRFLHINGGPRANHTIAKAVGQKDLPFHAVGVMNTFYLTQGDGNIKYTIN